MVYDCLFYNGNFVIAKPFGWVWSNVERQLPFEIDQTEELAQSETDYQVTVNGVQLWASQIDGGLING